MKRKTPLTELQEIAYSMNMSGVNPKVTKALFTYIGALEAALYMVVSDDYDVEAVKDWYKEQELIIGLRLAKIKKGLI